MGVRVYVPQLGRFLQTDPVLGGSASAYDHCYGDPINCTDLDGRIAIPLVAVAWAWIPGLGWVVAGAIIAHAAYKGYQIHKAKRSRSRGHGVDEVEGGHSKGKRRSQEGKHQEG
jgi:hypothetical protein